MRVVLFFINIVWDDWDGALKYGFFVDIERYVLFCLYFFTTEPQLCSAIKIRRRMK